MFKKYIQDIAKHEARKILLSNYKEKLVYEIKQKKGLEEENRRIKSQLSNNVYFKMYQKQVEHTELFVKEKDKEISELNDLYEQEKNKNYKTLESEELKQKNELLKEAIENLEGKLILKGNLLSEQKEKNKELKNTLKGSKNTILELKELYSKEKLEKNKLLFNGYGEKYEIEKLKKELRDSKNGLNGANDIIKNMKQENKKLIEKLDGIKFVTRKQCVRPLTYDNLKKAVLLIENILKES